MTRQSGTVAERKTMSNRTYLLPCALQARELGISRGRLGFGAFPRNARRLRYYLPKPVSPANFVIIRRINSRLVRLESLQRPGGEHQRQIEADAEDFLCKIEALTKGY